MQCTHAAALAEDMPAAGAPERLQRTAVSRSCRPVPISMQIALTIPPLPAAALLCLKPAKEGGYSTWASSYSIYNAMLEKHPELAEVMTRDYYVDRKDEIPEGEGPWYKLPVFNFHKVGTSLILCYSQLPQAAAQLV